MEQRHVQNVVNKNRLLKLRNKYIKELQVLKGVIPPNKGKTVRFSPEIEQIVEDDTTCACDLKCVLENNTWKCIRRNSYI